MCVSATDPTFRLLLSRHAEPSTGWSATASLFTGEPPNGRLSKLPRLISCAKNTVLTSPSSNSLNIIFIRERKCRSILPSCSEQTNWGQLYGHLSPAEFWQGSTTREEFLRIAGSRRILTSSTFFRDSSARPKPKRHSKASGSSSCLLMSLKYQWPNWPLPGLLRTLMSQQPSQVPRALNNYKRP